MDSNLSIEVSGAPGAECTTIIREMCDLASRMRLWVHANLNGVSVNARPYCDRERLCRDWQEAMSSERPYKYVAGREVKLGSAEQHSPEQTK